MSRSQELDDDTVILILIGIVGAPALLAGAVSVLPDFAQILLDLNILVHPDAFPVLQLPGAQGAGLDWVRLIPLAAVAIICLTWTVWLLQQRRHRTEDKRR